MGAHSPEEVKAHVNTYLKIFGVLMVLTVVTIGLRWFEMSMFWAVALAMVVATAKGSLVAAYFMHLKGEKKVIWWSLYLTVLFFVVLMMLPILTDLDQAVVK